MLSFRKKRDQLQHDSRREWHNVERISPYFLRWMTLSSDPLSCLKNIGVGYEGEGSVIVVVTAPLSYSMTEQPRLRNNKFGNRRKIMI